jgi:hypothetical protein
VFDPPLTQHADKHIRDAWIWAASLIAVAALLTASGLLAQVTNQGARDADAGPGRGQQTVHLVQER